MSDAPQKSPTPIRRGRIGTNVFVQLLLAIVLFGAVNYLSFRHYRRWDMTIAHEYTLSQTTTNFLSSLPQNAKLVVAFVRNSEIADDVRVLVEEYKRNANGRITVEFVDPARSPDKAEALKNTYKFSLERNTLIVDIEGRTRFLAETDLATFGEQGPEKRRILNFHGEDALTSALIQLSEADPSHLYLIAGKGLLPATEGGRDASQVLLDLAKKQNIDLRGLTLGDIDAVPADADGLVLIRPQQDLTEREIGLLRNYWQSSRGAFLLLRDPTQNTPRLDAFITGYGVRPRPDRVLFSENTPTGPSVVFRVTNTFNDGSPIVAPLLGTTTEFTGQSSSLALGENKESIQDNAIEIIPLTVASPRYWGETSYFQTLPAPGDGDTLPPVYTAASIERGAVSDARIRIDSSRMVVVANPTLLDPETLTSSNIDIASNAINWLLSRESLIGIPPKQKQLYRINIPAAERSRVFWIIAVILPATVLSFGFFIWSTRRS